MNKLALALLAATSLMGQDARQIVDLLAMQFSQCDVIDKHIRKEPYSN